MEPCQNMDEMLENIAVSLSSKFSTNLKKKINLQMEQLVTLFIAEMKESQNDIPIPSGAEPTSFLTLLDKRVANIEKKTRIIQKLKNKVRSTLKEKEDIEDKAKKSLKEKSEEFQLKTHHFQKKLEAAENLRNEADKLTREAQEKNDQILETVQRTQTEKQVALALNEVLNQQIGIYNQELDNAVTLAEKYFNEKIQFKTALVSLQNEQKIEEDS